MRADLISGQQPRYKNPPSRRWQQPSAFFIGVPPHHPGMRCPASHDPAPPPCPGELDASRPGENHSIRGKARPDYYLSQFLNYGGVDLQD